MQRDIQYPVWAKRRGKKRQSSATVFDSSHQDTVLTLLLFHAPRVGSCSRLPTSQAALSTQPWRHCGPSLWTRYRKHLSTSSRRVPRSPPLCSIAEVRLTIQLVWRDHSENIGAHTSGSSSQSDVLSAGKMTVLAPARRAATVFSRSPPMRRTFPVTVSSPVIAIVGSRGWFKARESKEVAIVMPAEGPLVIIRWGTVKKRENREKVIHTIFLNCALRAM